MTSNVGSELLRKANIGFSDIEKTQEEDKIAFEKRVKSILKDKFKPEFLNRIDEIVIFSNLSKEEITEIVENMLVDVQKRLDEHNVKLNVDKKAIETLVELGYDKEYGARPLRRLIQKEIENVLSSKIIAGEIENGAEVDVSISRGKLKIGVKENAGVKS